MVHVTFRIQLFPAIGVCNAGCCRRTSLASRQALPYRCILIATILSQANVEARSLAKMASTRIFPDCRRRIGDDVLERQAGQDIGGLP